MSNIYEKYNHNSISSYAETILSNLISAYKKPFSSNHVSQDKNFVGTVLMDLTKAFDCIPHDLRVVKLHAYGLSESGITFVCSYLKRRIHTVKISGIKSVFQILLSGMPPGFILGPIFFNILINDMFFFIKNV